MSVRAFKFKWFAGSSLTLGVVAFGICAAATPDISGTWQLNCLSEYKNIVSVMDPKLTPDSLANGFEIRGDKAYLAGRPTVPWLSIYNADLKPIYHAVGYNSRSDELWQLVTDKNEPTSHAPALYEIEPYTGARAADLPDADFTFVEYYAAWCTNCKLVESAFAEFKQTHPNLKITHVRINADTAKMQKKKYTSKSCPVTT